MFKDNLYKIISYSHHEGAINAVLEINKEDKIFSGHFPEHPVLPGACMLQIIKEILETTFKVSFRLRKATQIKFLVLINPNIDNTIHLKLTYNTGSQFDFDVIASLSQTAVCFKFKGNFAFVN